MLSSVKKALTKAIPRMLENALSKKYNQSSVSIADGPNMAASTDETISLIIIKLAQKVS